MYINNNDARFIKGVKISRTSGVTEYNLSGMEENYMDTIEVVQDCNAETLVISGDSINTETIVVLAKDVKTVIVRANKVISFVGLNFNGNDSLEVISLEAPSIYGRVITAADCNKLKEIALASEDISKLNSIKLFRNKKLENLNILGKDEKNISIPNTEVKDCPEFKGIVFTKSNI